MFLSIARHLVQAPAPYIATNLIVIDGLDVKDGRQPRYSVETIEIIAGADERLQANMSRDLQELLPSLPFSRADKSFSQGFTRQDTILEDAVNP